MPAPQSLYQTGTRLVGVHLHDFPGDGLALELRKDCPGPGEWVVVDYTGETECHFLYADERAAWAAYWRLEETLWAGRAHNAETADARIEAMANATRAAEMATVWENGMRA